MDRKACLLSDIAGAGFLAVFYMGLILFFDWNMYAFTVDGSYWLLFWCSGALGSFLVSQIAASYPKWTLPAYTAAAVMFFLLLKPSYTIVVSVLLSAACTLLLYFGKSLARKLKLFRYSFCVLPILCLLITLPDITIKKEWNEVVGKNSYSAYFLYFDGAKEIPIEVKKGEELLVTVKVKNENGGGYSYYIVDKQNRTVSSIKTNPSQLKLNIDKTDTYTIIVKGESLRGGFDVEWQNRTQDS
ncbi:hypothetical protein [Niallia sp. BSM11]|uniref:hypothetical protein n=1 Tax=Niallia sp. BSM11 TaxID=3391576 RepID=UPI003984E4B8